MQIVKKLALLLSLSLALFVGACSEGGVESESPGEQIEEGAEDLGEGIEEGAEEVEEGIEGEN
ncbi:MAG: hypothetical protein QNJ41_03465 [Xenococcaceae cyanobacterium MO_188.B32]|nr:hypothetical protein [Xenococcaceae cyanobacterium MO_188.B32]